MRGNYNICEDDAGMRALSDAEDAGTAFDDLRKTYRKRREFTNTVLTVPEDQSDLKRILGQFKFNIA